MPEIIRSYRAEAYLPWQILPWSGVPMTPTELAMGKRVIQVLRAHYPGHPWTVHVSEQGGVIIVRNSMLLHPTHGPRLAMVTHLAETLNDPSLNVIKRRAGEFLERWGQPRGGLRLAEVKRNHRRFLDANGVDMALDVRRVA